MGEKKSEVIRSLMINLGILLIFVSTMAANLGIVPFIVALFLLALQTFDFRSIEPPKLITAEIILASALSIATVIQLIMSKNFGTPQVFLIVLLLGSILVTVETVRKYADL